MEIPWARVILYGRERRIWEKTRQMPPSVLWKGLPSISRLCSGRPRNSLFEEVMLAAVTTFWRLTTIVFFFFMQWSKQFGLIGRQLFSLWRLMYSGSSHVVVPQSLEPRHPAGERKKIEDKKATPAFYKPWYRHDTHHIYSYSIGKNWIIYPQPDARRTWTYSPWPHSLDPAITPYYGRRSMTFWWKAGHLCH